jgi:apolipoprotein N-acyltransferase
VAAERSDHVVQAGRAPTGRKRWGVRLGAAGAGAAVALAFPQPGLWWWAYAGLVPVLLLVATAPSRHQALWRCWSAGCGYFLVLHHWLLPQLSVFVVPLVLVGLAWLPWGMAAWWLLRDPRSPRKVAAALVVVPSAWVVVEYLRSWDRLGGSWGVLGTSQWQVRPILAVAALGGVWALSFLLVCTGTALAVAVRPGTAWGMRLGAAAVVVVLIGGAAGYGLSRSDPDVQGTLRIGGVQPGKIDDRRERLVAHEDLSRDLAAADLDAVVWGQSSVGFDLETESWARDRLLALARELDRPVLVNVDARRPDGRIAKTMVVVRPEGLGETYAKQRLAPFGEYIPLRPLLGWVERFSKAAEEDRVPGTGLTTVRLGDATVGPLISYESTFPDMRRRNARAGVDLALVQAAATTFQGTWALPQQASFEAVRAVESGRPAVLVAVSGTSAAFDARGGASPGSTSTRPVRARSPSPCPRRKRYSSGWGTGCRWPASLSWWWPPSPRAFRSGIGASTGRPLARWRRAHGELGASAAPLARSAPCRGGATDGGGRICAVQPLGGTRRRGRTVRRPRCR